MDAAGAGAAMPDTLQPPPGKPGTERNRWVVCRAFHALNTGCNRYWRICGTGICFAAFGIGALGLRLLAFPLLNTLVHDLEHRKLRARQLIRLAFRSLVWLMRVLGVLSYEIKGLERLQRQGLLILSNHPSLIDTVLLMAFVHHADCIVKDALWNSPITRGPVRSAGYISNAQGPELVNDCIASLRQGSNLIIFPEGTRTPTDDVLHFKRGAANVALRGNYAITPVIIRCVPATLRKGSKWWQVAPTMPHISLTVRPDIDIQKMTGKELNPSLAARHLTNYLQDYFTRES